MQVSGDWKEIHKREEGCLSNRRRENRDNSIKGNDVIPETFFEKVWAKKNDIQKIDIGKTTEITVRQNVTIRQMEKAIKRNKNVVQ